jgi:SNF2 family DNA or RNA helicase
MRKTQIGVRVRFTIAVIQLTHEAVSVGGPVLRSAKTKAAEAQIESWLADDPDAKIIVFTQFIGMLKVMSRICTEREWGHTLFHGGMSFDSRDNAIQNFSKDADTKILCASLKAGGVGLNLTAASRVIVVDLWWNESVVSFLSLLELIQIKIAD